jgi:hypothetical protein
MVYQRNSRKGLRGFIPAMFIALSLFGSSHAQAGTTVRYFGRCSFLDRGNNNGGKIFNMPCYVVSGGHMRSMFFHIVWKDGIKTRLNAKINTGYIEASTGRQYTQIGMNSFSAVQDGDVIILERPEYSDKQYEIDDPIVMKLLK